MSILAYRNVIIGLTVFATLWIVFLFFSQFLLEFEHNKELEERFSIIKSTPLRELVDSIQLNGKDIIDNDTSLEEDFAGACEIPTDPTYPDCKNRIQSLRQSWSKNPCYKEYGVDGRLCSIIIYLSEVEAWCPKLPWRRSLDKRPVRKVKLEEKRTLFGVQSLMKDLGKIRWIRGRLQTMWEYWVSALKKNSEQLKNRELKSIIVFIGSLANAPGTMNNLTAFDQRLDELTQWSDLITSLYLLGHDVTVVTRRDDLIGYLSMEDEIGEPISQGCSEKKSHSGFDLFYLDMQGLHHIVHSLDQELKMRVWSRYSCRLRISAPFGIEAIFNYREYKEDVPDEAINWGHWNLNLQQFMTLFPHSHDNSLLGFALGGTANITNEVNSKRIINMLYGTPKDSHAQQMDLLHKHRPLHAITTKDDKVPSFIKTYDVKDYVNMDLLFRKTKVFYGLNFPYETLAPLHAIARGAIFINPKFSVPKHRQNSEFLKNKPTLRKMTSQHMFLEEYFGKPFTWTIDTGNVTHLLKTLKTISMLTVKPKIPREFTCDGMLERISAYVEYQDFCKKKDWPPIEAMEIFSGDWGESCSDTCKRKGMICEPHFFPVVNETAGVSCESTRSIPSPYAPAMNTSMTNCVFQTESLLYSCSGGDPQYKRLCPCRDHIPGQWSLCKVCLREEKHENQEEEFSDHSEKKSSGKKNERLNRWLKRD